MKTAAIVSLAFALAASAAPTPAASGCVAKDNACRASDPVTGLSANQAQCSSENASCQGDCYDAYNECRSAPDANMSYCASQYAGCLGQNPFGSDGSLVIKPAVKARSEENCVAKDNACRASDPVTGLSANQAQCSSENAACKGSCDESYNACRTARPNGLSANMAQCASEYVGCLGENVFEKRSAPAGAFGGLAIHSGSDIQYASVNAAGSTFWLNKDSSVYCPKVDGLVCSNTTTTQFIGGDNTLSLDTTVPGGQQIYVSEEGRLSFTVPHSAYTGEGSSSTGFSIAQEGQHLQYQGSDFLACPVDDAYAVYAAVAKKDASEDCLGFAFRISETSAPAAWEYS